MKNFAKNFYNQVTSSIYNPEFYKELDSKPTSFTIIYLIKLACLMALIATIFCFAFFYKFQKDAIKNSGSENFGAIMTKYVDTYFTNDLVVTFKDGKLSTNKSEPVVFPIPNTWFNLEQAKPGEMENIATLAPTQNFSSELFDQFSSYAVFASSSVGYYNPNQGDVRTFDYVDATSTYSDLVINKNLAKEKADLVGAYINKALPFIDILLIILVFLGCSIFVFLAGLLFALITGLLTFIIGKLTGVNRTYGIWYLKAIHADTLYVLLNWTLGWFISFSSILFLNTILVLVVLFINKNFKK